MRARLAILWMTFRELRKDRGSWTFLGLSVIWILLAYKFADFAMFEAERYAASFLHAGMVLWGVLWVLMETLALMIREYERKTLWVYLSRPLSRAAYFEGRFLGFVLFLTLFTLLWILGGGSILQLVHRTMAHPYGTPVDLNRELFRLAAVGVALALLQAVLFFLLSFFESPLLVVVGGFAVFLVGTTLEEVYRFLLSPTGQAMFPASFQRVVDQLEWIWPHFDYLLRTPESHPLGIVAYALAYIFALIELGSLLFERREFT